MHFSFMLFGIHCQTNNGYKLTVSPILDLFPERKFVTLVELGLVFLNHRRSSSLPPISMYFKRSYWLFYYGLATETWILLSKLYIAIIIIMIATFVKSVLSASSQINIRYRSSWFPTHYRKSFTVLKLASLPRTVIWHIDLLAHHKLTVYWSSCETIINLLVHHIMWY